MLSTSGRVSPNLRGCAYQYSIPHNTTTPTVSSPRPHHFNESADRAHFGDDVCSAAIHVRDNNDWPAEFEKTLKGLKEVPPGLIVPSNVVDLEVPEIGRIHLYADVNYTGSANLSELTE